MLQFPLGCHSKEDGGGLQAAGECPSKPGPCVSFSSFSLDSSEYPENPTSRERLELWVGKPGAVVEELIKKSQEFHQNVTHRTLSLCLQARGPSASWFLGLPAAPCILPLPPQEGARGLSPTSNSILYSLPKTRTTLVAESPCCLPNAWILAFTYKYV